MIRALYILILVLTLNPLQTSNAISQNQDAQSNVFVKHLNNEIQFIVEEIKKKKDERVIYGVDDRLNYVDLDIRGIDRVSDYQRYAADSTAILVKNTKLKEDKNGIKRILTSTPYGLCEPFEALRHRDKRERFYDEPAPGFCSGFRVGENLVATAGHCIKNSEDQEKGKLCDETKVVFKFRKQSEFDKPELNVLEKYIYQCERVVGHQLNSEIGLDWAIIEVDREIEDDIPTAILRRNSDHIPFSTTNSLTVIGYPLGLPVKITNQGKVREGHGNDYHFMATMDTYQGNSGSPVFKTERIMEHNPYVEGILIGGDADTVTMDTSEGGTCKLSIMCEENGCKGERVTRANAISYTIPE